MGQAAFLYSTNSVAMGPGATFWVGLVGREMGAERAMYLSPAVHWNPMAAANEVVVERRVVKAVRGRREYWIQVHNSGSAFVTFNIEGLFWSR